MKLDKKALGLALGIPWAAAVFAATFWVTYRGGGEHFEMIKRFYLGFQLSPPGAVIGAAWAFVHGFVTGWLVAWLYNRFHSA